MRTLLLLFLVSTLGWAQPSFEVIHKRALWFDQKGSLEISDAGLSFQPQGKEEKARTWAYQDIQFLERLSPTEIKLLTYEDVAWKLGQDRGYLFELVNTELSDELFERLVQSIGKPAGDRVVEKPAAAELELPAKRLKTFNGSEGTLFFSPERIVYRAEAPDESRAWMINRDVQSVWSSTPYRLEVHVYEEELGALAKPRVYKFALKRPLDREFYRHLKLKLYDVERRRDSGR